MSGARKDEHKDAGMANSDDSWLHSLLNSSDTEAKSQNEMFIAVDRLLDQVKREHTEIIDEQKKQAIQLDMSTQAEMSIEGGIEADLRDKTKFIQKNLYAFEFKVNRLLRFFSSYKNDTLSSGGKSLLQNRLLVANALRKKIETIKKMNSAVEKSNKEMGRDRLARLTAVDEVGEKLAGFYSTIQKFKDHENLQGDSAKLDKFHKEYEQSLDKMGIEADSLFLRLQSILYLVSKDKKYEAQIEKIIADFRERATESSEGTVRQIFSGALTSRQKWNSAYTEAQVNSFDFIDIINSFFKMERQNKEGVRGKLTGSTRLAAAEKVIQPLLNREEKSDSDKATNEVVKIVRLLNELVIFKQTYIEGYKATKDELYISDKNNTEYHLNSAEFANNQLKKGFIPLAPDKRALVMPDFDEDLAEWKKTRLGKFLTGWNQYDLSEYLAGSEKYKLYNEGLTGWKKYALIAGIAVLVIGVIALTGGLAAIPGLAIGAVYMGAIGAVTSIAGGFVTALAIRSQMFREWYSGLDTVPKGLVAASVGIIGLASLVFAGGFIAAAALATSIGVVAAQVGAAIMGGSALTAFSVGAGATASVIIAAKAVDMAADEPQMSRDTTASTPSAAPPAAEKVADAGKGGVQVDNKPGVSRSPAAVLGGSTSRINEIQERKAKEGAAVSPLGQAPGVATVAGGLATVAETAESVAASASQDAAPVKFHPAPGVSNKAPEQKASVPKSDLRDPREVRSGTKETVSFDIPGESATGTPATGAPSDSLNQPQHATSPESPPDQSRSSTPKIGQ